MITQEKSRGPRPLSASPSIVALHGRPLHPMLITSAIAFLIGVFAADAAYWWPGDAFWARVAFWLIVGDLFSGKLVFRHLIGTGVKQ